MPVYSPEALDQYMSHNNNVQASIPPGDTSNVSLPGIAPSSSGNNWHGYTYGYPPAGPTARASQSSGPAVANTPPSVGWYAPPVVYNLPNTSTPSTITPVVQAPPYHTNAIVTSPSATSMSPNMRHLTKRDIYENALSQRRSSVNNRERYADVNIPIIGTGPGQTFSAATRKQFAGAHRKSSVSMEDISMHAHDFVANAERTEAVGGEPLAASRSSPLISTNAHHMINHA
jgi:hypothetical protein